MIAPLKFWQVDAFASVPFKGNPAAVLVLDDPLGEDLMQNITIEMNLAETAFILRRAGQNPLLRWFTSQGEIDLCGHATLASAHIYLSEVAPAQTDVTFDTKFVGPLHVSKNENGYTMNFPSRPGEAVAIGDVPDFVMDALTPARPVEARKARDLMLVYDREVDVRGIEPDFSALRKYPHPVIATARSDRSEFDFISRFFHAGDAVPEDPVTGSAHCTSAPYWGGKLGKTEMRAWQASPRGGALHLELLGERVNISGPAVTVIEGVIRASQR